MKPTQSERQSAAPINAARRAALAESEYLLCRWDFRATAAGDLLFRARRKGCSIATLAGLLMLLRQAADQTFPRTVVFNFQDCRMEGEEWTGVCGLLEDFVGALGGKLVILPGHHGHQIYVCDRRNVATT